MALSTTTSIKGDKKPTQDAQDLGIEQGTDEQSLSSIGDKNVSTNTMGGGDGSFPGGNSNEFIDPREVDGYDNETGELSGDAKQLMDDAAADRQEAIDAAQSNDAAQTNTEDGAAAEADTTDKSVTSQPSSGTVKTL